MTTQTQTGGDFILAPADLYSLEEYARRRDEFRKRVMAHKKNRRVALGDNATLYFEDRLTMQYQVQEVLRIEKIFEAQEISQELEAYNPLIPDGRNWKATFMIEYPDEVERRAALAQLIGIEKAVWVQVAGHERVVPFADEDLQRTTVDKTSAVHFLRFELTAAMVTALKNGAALSMGIEHDKYDVRVDPVEDAVRQSLLADLQ